MKIVSISRAQLENIADPGPLPQDLIDEPEPPVNGFAECARLCKALGSMSKTEAWAALAFINNPETTMAKVSRYSGCSVKTIRRAVAKLTAALRGRNTPPGIGSSKRNSHKEGKRRGRQAKLTNAGKFSRNGI